MKVFIMWAGEETKPFAEAFYKFLRVVVQAPDYFLSTQDIDKGALWGASLGEELKTTSFGIACITKRNMGSPWIHFEAGAIAKMGGESRVVPYLIGMRDAELTGPLSQFQVTICSKTETLELVKAINVACEAKQNPPEVVEEAFHAHWPKLETAIAELKQVPLQGSTSSTTAAPTPTQSRSAEDMLSEILERLREQERRPLVSQRSRASTPRGFNVAAAPQSEIEALQRRVDAVQAEDKSDLHAQVDHLNFVFGEAERANTMGARLDALHRFTGAAAQLDALLRAYEAEMAADK